tara:strand:+ start:579 stop:836 length:258 start_codon:yes stop_codon:yes gene_type:complete
MSKSNRERWNKIATEKLKGRKILKVRYMKKEEADNWGFMSQPLVLFLDDQSILVPQRDDEGNDAGALVKVHNNGTAETILPVLRE